MKLLLCRSRSPASALIRFFCWSGFSHSALLDAQAGVVWDATFWHGGVRKWRWVDWQRKYSRIEERDSGLIDMDGARQWLDAQVGKPYDWRALLGIFFRQGGWSDERAWFCSELTEAARNRFGAPRFRADAQRITPGHQEIAL